MCDIGCAGFPMATIHPLHSNGILLHQYWGNRGYSSSIFFFQQESVFLDDRGTEATGNKSNHPVGRAGH